jgi:hypothetical protein
MGLLRRADPASRRSYGERRSARAAAVLLAIVSLVAVPVLVVLVASDDTVSSVRPGAPGSDDPLRPSAPFLAGIGDGVRPSGIACSTTPQTALRARAHLDLFADARRVRVPERVGVRPTCAYWVRTEDADGVITIGSPERRAFTLGDFFDVWGAPLTPTRVLTFRVSERRPLRVFVDGRRVSGDPRSVRLRDGRQIALVVGRRPRTVPSSFAFPRAG